MKEFLKSTPVYPLIARIRGRLKKRHPLQRLKRSDRYNLVRLGSEYGGWTFVDDESLYGATIVSAGLGEDASFDVEFASRYDSKVLIVDPTPRAIAHFQAILENIGKTRATQYGPTGNQPVDAYDLKNVSVSNLLFDKRALWSEVGTVKFFQPKDPGHVSHSIVNFQQGYREDTPYFEVEALPLKSLLLEHGIDPEAVSLVKLDIEGAEIEVLESMIADRILPKQICVEFDELNVPSDKAFERVDKVHALLERNGYECIYTDGQADFLYIRPAEFAADR